jgi:hypothetical protein
VGLVLSSGIAGCGSRADLDAARRFRPPVDLARAALSASLRAWQEGRPGGPATAGSRGVEVSDSYRKPGRPLSAFEVLGPVDAGEAQGFAVKLSLANPREDQFVRYVVIGDNPLWVFRQEDYERIAHWEHKPEDEPTPTPEPAAGPAPTPKP